MATNTNNDQSGNLPDISEMLNLKKRLESKKRGEMPSDSELTGASFKLLCDFMPFFMESMKELKGLATFNTELKNDLLGLKDDLKAYRNDISEIKTELKEIQSQTKSEIKELKDESASLKLVAQDHTGVLEILQGKISDFEKKFLTQEIEKSESCVLLRNFAGAGPKENRKSLRDSFMKLLQFLRLENRVHVLDIFRLISKNPQGVSTNSKYPVVKICFSSKYEKLILMGNLKNLKNSPYSNIRFSDDVPHSLREDFAKVDLEGFKIREANGKGTLVRYPIRDFKYQLEFKRPNEETYTRIEFQDVHFQNPNQNSNQNSQNNDPKCPENPNKRQKPSNTPEKS